MLTSSLTKVHLEVGGSDVIQCSPLSLVEECRGLALIGREVHSVATPASRELWMPELVLYGIREIRLDPPHRVELCGLIALSN